MSAKKPEPIPTPQTPATVAGIPKPKGTFSPEIPGPQRVEFRRYLEKTGLLDAMSVSLAHLYEEDEKISNPVEYFVNRLMGWVPSKVEMGTLRAEKEALQKEIADLKSLNKELKEKAIAEEEIRQRSAYATATTGDYDTETHGED